MEKWLEFVSIIASLCTLIGFVAIFIRLGKEKGVMDVTMKELRKDVDCNHNDINLLKKDVNEMQIKNITMMTSFSSDLGWIKSSLSDIKNEMISKQNKKE